ncbi:5'/3'-nucleotidase SurE [Endozoicomonas numazuensis]|uniref:5'-nucleotidase SurE n=1 Tax=Endozoicomonas numazuensis TaxID=1137799 RepID=A0A081NH64_9GAMM|nr:5'/3'-nucleotidase SurE [Endozoicomonas numazuensis]KEQ17787.1 stationary phase survival protein SurE [Endozoicomonas numazuensis]
MRILLSNDDGVAAMGLATLHNSLEGVGERIVFAPDRNSSGLSSSLTLDRPLRVTEHPSGFHSVDGTPADCVHLAVNALLESEPDIVVSGINHGANLGDDVLYSGTVGAALEGRFMGMPAIAVSACGKGEQGFQAAGRVVRDLVLRLKDLSLPAGTILNINVPDMSYEQIKGVAVTRLGHRERPEKPVKVMDPRGKPAYWIAPVGKEQDAGEGTDFHAIEKGFVSVTPLQYDQTHHATLSQLSEWLGS